MPPPAPRAELTLPRLNDCFATPDAPLAPLEPFHASSILPWTHDNVTSPDRMADEAKFQISVRKEVFRCSPAHFYIAYTQHSLWQIYDARHSRPFRTTDYNPDLHVEIRAALGRGWPQMLRAGVEHESNGQDVPESRSWNRLYVEPGWGHPGSRGFATKVWWRFPESGKSSKSDPAGDDNPTIQDYLGFMELYGWWTDALGRRLSGMLRRGYNDGTETLRLDLDWPLKFMGFGVMLRMELFAGYGETLIDFNRRVNRIGLGLVFQ